MRASRLVALLGLLQSRGRLTAPQLAAELEVSQRTILRDVEALSSAGVPVYAVRGRAGGFQLLAGFSSDLPAAASPRSAVTAARPGAEGRGRARIRISPRGRRLAVLTGRPPGIRLLRGTRAGGPRRDWANAWMPVESADTAVLDILSLGPETEVLEPAELRIRVRREAARIAELHSGGRPTDWAGA